MVRSLAFFPTQHCGALRAGHSFPPSPLRQAYRGGQRLRRSPRQAGGLVPLRAGLTPQQAQAAEPGGNSATSAAPDSTGHGTASNGSPSATNGSSSNGIGTGAGKTTVVAKEDFTKFVQFFRGASPYIEGHRGRCFVIVVPGQVRQRPQLPNRGRAA